MLEFTILISLNLGSTHCRIFGGESAELGQFPYQVSLREPQYIHFCNGFIINSKWIGTSGNCATGRFARNVKAVLGAIDRFDSGVFFNVDKIFAHPEFDNPNKLNDIGLVLVNTEIFENDVIKRVPLGSEHVVSGSAVVSAWGRVDESSEYSEKLEFITVEVFDNEQCRQKLQETGHETEVHEQTICSITQSGIGTCRGKSFNAVNHLFD